MPSVHIAQVEHSSSIINRLIRFLIKLRIKFSWRPQLQLFSILLRRPNYIQSCPRWLLNKHHIGLVRGWNIARQFLILFRTFLQSCRSFTWRCILNWRSSASCFFDSWCIGRRNCWLLLGLRTWLRNRSFLSSSFGSSCVDRCCVYWLVSGRRCFFFFLISAHVK